MLQGNDPEPIRTTESDGEMLRRACGDLLNHKNVNVFNDEAHHCYRHKAGGEEEKLTGDDKKEAEANEEAARLWINGIEALKRKVGVRAVLDLSATPFFLRGSGYPEGFRFPWVVSNFSLMDAIECGIVKLPRVPVADNLPQNETLVTATCGSTSARICRKAPPPLASSILGACPTSSRLRSTCCSVITNLAGRDVANICNRGVEFCKECPFESDRGHHRPRVSLGSRA